MTAATHEEDLGRLRWRCRRGMKELDLVLERYLSEGYPDAGTRLQRAFAGLLELPDPVLQAYVLGGAVPEEEALRDVVGAITGSAR